MELIFVDPEPPDQAGGGIRTYLRLALRICQDFGITATLYTHNRHAFANSKAKIMSIGRTPHLASPWRWIAYRFQYSQNVFWEQANWLAKELEAHDGPEKLYEFADFYGYGFFVLKNQGMRNRTIIRVHTPDFLVPGKPKGFQSLVAKWQGAWREKFCLAKARHITVPSAEFMDEMLPYLKSWVHIPNPIPTDVKKVRAPDDSFPERFLYLGRVEPRKGVLPLVRAFLKLLSERPNASLTLVGGAVPGPYSESVLSLIESQSAELRLRLKWLPACSAEMRQDLFSQFQVIVVPSLWENSPYVYFEGLSAGLVCLGSATGEMKAVAKATGGPSALPGNEADWFRALKQVSSQPAKPTLLAQNAYLQKRQAEIPKQLIDYYRTLVKP